MWTYEEVQGRSEDIPDDFKCGISMGIMQKPVLASDGHLYDLASLQNWYNVQTEKGLAFTSPFTREKLSEQVELQVEFSNAIRSWVRKNPDKIKMELNMF